MVRNRRSSESLSALQSCRVGYAFRDPCSSQPTSQPIDGFNISTQQIDNTSSIERIPFSLTTPGIPSDMASSPHKNSQHFPPTSTLQPASPRTAGRLRKLQSQPSLISQQRQQQLRNESATQNAPSMPPIPLPMKHTRTRSNSDAVVPSFSKDGRSPQRGLTSRRMENPKDELKSLIRRGPRGDLPDALQSLRHWILVDGLETDTDGMVGLC